MRWLKNFGRFWYDFIVGDDWTVAAGVVAAVGLTAIIAHSGVTAWPVVPLVVVIMLVGSIWRARRAATRRAGHTTEHQP